MRILNMKNKDGKFKNIEFSELGIEIKLYYPLINNNSTENHAYLDSYSNNGPDSSNNGHDSIEMPKNEVFSILLEKILVIQTKMNDFIKSSTLDVPSKNPDSQSKNDNLNSLFDELESVMIDYLLIFPTTNNPSSSRAFTIFDINCVYKGDGGGKVFESKVRFIDLPGIEKTIDIRQELLFKGEPEEISKQLKLPTVYGDSPELKTALSYLIDEGLTEEDVPFNIEKQQYKLASESHNRKILCQLDFSNKQNIFFRKNRDAFNEILKYIGSLFKGGASPNRSFILTSCPKLISISEVSNCRAWLLQDTVH